MKCASLAILTTAMLVWACSPSSETAEARPPEASVAEDGKRVWTIGDGRVTLTAPDSWRRGEDADFDLVLEHDYVSETDQGGIRSSIMCLGKMLRAVYPPNLSNQEALNRMITTENATRSLPPDSEPIYISVDRMAGASRLASVGYLSAPYADAPDEIDRTDRRTGYISEGGTSWTFMVSCSTFGEGDLNPDALKDVETFLDSLTVTPR